MHWLQDLTLFEYLTLGVSFTALLLIPIVVMLVRGATKWTRTEDKLDTLIRDVRELVIDKDKTHTEMLSTMREDRVATDRRLRWLEEHLWRGGP